MSLMPRVARDQSKADSSKRRDAPARHAPVAPPRRGRYWARLILWCAAGLASVAAALKAAGLFTPAPAGTPREIAAAYRARAADRGAAGDSALAPSSPLFTDVAPSVGIDFVHDNAARGNFFLPEEMGPGGGFLDYDNDGDLDIFIAGGGAIIADGPPQSCRLYRNDGDLFTDVTESSGADVNGPAYGVACADYDNDGDVDIFVTRLGVNALLRNRGDGTFTEAAAEAGLDDTGFGTAAAFFDHNRDGLLDLYVANYVDWSPQLERACYDIAGERDYCHPSLYEAPPLHRLYENLGDGRFEDITEASGIGAERGQGLGIIAHDFDGDGWTDLYVANDNTPAFLWHNQGDGTFENVAPLSGAAFDGRGVAIAGMGVASDDFDGDGDFDILVANISGQNHLVLQNDAGQFADVSLKMGMGKWSIPFTAFGVVVFDQDHDGNLDAYFANGAVNSGIAGRQVDDRYAEPDHFVRLRNGQFTDATAGSGAAREVGRGLAGGDYDGDGDLDLLLLNNGGPARLLRNNNSNRKAWLIIDARHGEPERAAIGARVIARTRNLTLQREVRPHTSYLSSCDPRVHFGLGDAAKIDELTIVWPDGARQTLRDVRVNQALVVRQGAADEPSRGEEGAGLP